MQNISIHKKNSPSALAKQTLGKSAFVLVLSLALAGCGGAQSPTFLLFESYFPSWLIGIFAAVPVTLIIRALLIRAGIDEELPLRFLFYVCLGLCFSMAFAYYFSPR